MIVYSSLSCIMQRSYYMQQVDEQIRTTQYKIISSIITNRNHFTSAQVRHNNFSGTICKYVLFILYMICMSKDIRAEIIECADLSNCCGGASDILFASSVSSIPDYAFKGCTSLVSVIIPSNVTTIGQNAFDSCTNLVTVSLPESLTEISPSLFFECTSLTKITIPPNVASIGASAFDTCTSLSAIEIPPSVVTIDDYAFSENHALKQLVLPDALTDLGEGVFYNCNSLQQLIIPNGVKSLKQRLFHLCSSIKHISIPSSVTEILDDVFKECVSLESILIPASIVTMSSTAFYHNAALTCLNIDPASPLPLPITCNGDCGSTFLFGCPITPPDIVECSDLSNCCGGASDIIIASSVSSIPDYAFEGCSSLVSVIIPSNVTTIGQHAFDSCTNLVTVSLPESLTEISPSLFFKCTSLTKITIPPNVALIGASAFDTCTSLSAIEIPPSVVSISDYAFSENHALKQLVLPDALTDLGEGVFYNCSSLSQLIIPNGVKSLKERLFHLCSSIKSISIPSSVTEILDDVFKECVTLKKLFIPASVTTISATAFYHNTALTCLNIDPSSPLSLPIACYGVCGSIDLSACPIIECAELSNCCGEASNIIIASSVSSIPDYAFEGCASLVSVIIPSNVTSIGQHAFESCTNLVNISLPQSLTEISPSLFFECTSLTKITIPPNVASIGASAFDTCTSLSAIEIPPSVVSISDYAFSENHALKQLVLPDALTDLGEGVFYNCNSLQQLIIPNGVKSLKQRLFHLCSSIKHISIPSSATEILDDVFKECVSLESILIPASIVTMSSTAFYHNAALTCLNIDPASPLTLPITCNGDCGSTFLFACPITPPDRVECSDLSNCCGGASDIIFASSVSSIPDYAFKGCTSLVSVIIPSNVTSIGQHAFESCTNLVNVSLPQSLTEISPFLFFECTSLTNITIPPNVASIGASAFDTCTSLSAIEIPPSVVTIDDYAFSENHALKQLVLPDALTDLGEGVFYNCNSLQQLIIPNGVKSLKERLFHLCSSIKHISIPSSVTEILDDVFKECVSLKKLFIPASVTTISATAFYHNTALTCLNIDPASPLLLPIACYGVCGSKNLAACPIIECAELSNCCGEASDIIIASSVSSIPDYAFEGCASLVSVIITSNVASIGQHAFESCTNLVSVSLPQSLTEISQFLFFKCTSLTKITIPPNVASIGASAFDTCTSLRAIEIPPSVVTIDDYAFSENHALKQLVLPDALTDLGEGVFYNCNSLQQLIIPNGVKSLKERLFHLCSSIKHISIPSSATEILDDVFKECVSLKKLFIPASVTTISATAFYHNAALTCLNIDPASPLTLPITCNGDCGSTNLFACPITPAPTLTGHLRIDLPTSTVWTNGDLPIYIRANIKCNGDVDANWTILDSTDNHPPLLPDISLTSIVRRFQRTEAILDVSFDLVIAPYFLSSGNEYVFQLTADCRLGQSSSKTAYVYIRQAPFGGFLTIFPSSGYALNTTFELEGLSWRAAAADSYPLSYSFFFSQICDFDNSLIMRNRSVSSYLITNLPAGYSSYNFTVYLYLRIHDIFDAISHYNTSAQVYLSEFSQNDLLNYFRLNINSTSRLDWSYQARIIITTLANSNSLQCELIKDCGYRKRTSCIHVGIINTCGQSRQIDEGPQFLPFRHLGEFCSYSFECLYGSCILNKCVSLNQSCGSFEGRQCSGRGYCVYLDTYGNRLPQCSDNLCRAICNCDIDYTGTDCRFYSKGRAQLISESCTLLKDIINSANISRELLSTFVQYIELAFKYEDMESIEAYQQCLDLLLSSSALFESDTLDLSTSGLNIISTSFANLNIFYMILSRYKEVLFRSSIYHQLTEITDSLVKAVQELLAPGQAPLDILTSAMRTSNRNSLLADTSNFILSFPEVNQVVSVEFNNSGLQVCPSSKYGYISYTFSDKRNVFKSDELSISPIIRWQSQDIFEDDKTKLKTESSMESFLLRFQFFSKQNFILETTGSFSNQTVPSCMTYSNGDGFSSQCSVQSYTNISTVCFCPDSRALCPALSKQRKLQESDMSKEYYVVLDKMINKIYSINSDPIPIISGVVIFAIFLSLFAFFVSGFVFFFNWDSHDRKISQYGKMRKNSMKASSEFVSTETLKCLRERIDELFMDRVNINVDDADFMFYDLELERRSSNVWNAIRRSRKWLYERFHFMMEKRSILTESSLFSLVTRALLRFHPILTLVSGPSTVRSRLLKFVSLFKSLVIVLFTSTLIFSLYFPYDNNCHEFKNEISCLNNKSELMEEESLCSWIESTSSCSLRMNPDFLFSVAVITSFISFPIDLILSWLLLTICCMHPNWYILRRYINSQVSNHDLPQVSSSYRDALVAYVVSTLRLFRANMESNVYSKRQIAAIEEFVTETGLKFSKRDQHIHLNWINSLWFPNASALITSRVDYAIRRGLILAKAVTKEPDICDSVLMHSFTYEQLGKGQSFIVEPLLDQRYIQSIHPVFWIVGWIVLIVLILYFVVWILLWSYRYADLRFQFALINAAIEIALVMFVTSTIRIFVVHVALFILIRPHVICIVDKLCDVANDVIQYESERGASHLFQAISPSCLASKMIKERVQTGNDLTFLLSNITDYDIISMRKLRVYLDKSKDDGIAFQNEHDFSLTSGLIFENSESFNSCETV